MKQPEEYQRRVLSEKRYLDDKLAALDGFIAGEKFSQLDSMQQQLLRMQNAIMYAYSGVLDLRIQGFGLTAHSGSCSNFNAVDPAGRYVGAEDCGCLQQ